MSGHTHSLVRAIEAGVPIVQARSNGRAVGVMDLVPGEPPVVSVRDVLTDSVAPSPRIDSLARRALASVASRVGARVADIPAHLARSGEEHALGHLIADAQRWAARADVAVTNNGGIRADLPAGTATYGRLFEVQPFGNTLHRFRLHGRDLRAYLEKIVGGTTPPRVHVSGVTVTYDPRRAGGQSSRLRDDSRMGARFGTTRSTRSVMNNFMAMGGDGLALGSDALAQRGAGDRRSRCAHQVPEAAAATRSRADGAADRRGGLVTAERSRLRERAAGRGARVARPSKTLCACWNAEEAERRRARRAPRHGQSRLARDA